MPVKKTSTCDELIERLPIDPGEMIAFKMPKSAQQRLARLSERSRDGTLGFEEQLELQRFLVVEAVVRVLKSKAVLWQRPAPKNGNAKLKVTSKHCSDPWTEADILNSLPKDREALMKYRFPAPMQKRAKELLKKSKAGKLDDEGQREIDRLLNLEGKILLLKAEAMKAKNREA